jgi:hypothetical protein
LEKAARFGLGLAVTLAVLVGCRPTQEEAPSESPAPAPTTVAAPADPALPAESPPPDEPNTERGQWFYAETFKDLHAARVEALESGDVPRPGSFTPHADAVMWRGETYGVAGGNFSFIRVDPTEALDGVVMAHMDGDRPTPRALDTFEQDALSELMGGADWYFSDIGPRAVGALRNGASCRGCHTTQRRGALLGAYAYQFETIADD